MEKVEKIKEVVEEEKKASKKGLKKLLKKANKKLQQAIKTITSVEEKNLLEEIASEVPENKIFLVHFGRGVEEDYTGLERYFEEQGFGDTNLDIYPAFPHGMVEFKSKEQSLSFVKSLTPIKESENKAYFAEIEFDDSTSKRICLFFYSKIDKSELNSDQKNQLPDASYEAEGLPGLIIHHDFITPEEEASFFEEIDSKEWINLKKRRIQHYGYDFIYGINKVNKDKKIGDLPEWLGPSLKNLNEICREFNSDKDLDQLTINEYNPGDGIPPHVDAHSPFEQAVAIISIGSGLVMSFKSKEGDQKHVYLPRRSAYILTGETRYGWYHSVPLRKVDRVDGKLKFRQRRISLTFRTVRKNKACECDFEYFCDSRGFSQDLVKIPNLMNKNEDGKGKVVYNDEEEQKLIDQARESKEEEKPTDMEKKYVYDVYEKIAPHFSHTRYKAWPQVEKFLMEIPKGSVVADVGCGNGKYLNLNPDLVMIGTDITNNLLKICYEEKNANVFRADSLFLPVKSNIVDYVISIAVIHHFSNSNLRKKALEELLRIVRPGGKVLVTVWALEQNKKFKTADVFVPWNLHNKYHKENVKGGIEEEDAVQKVIEEGENRPEVYENEEKQAVVYKRYYHLFVFKELETLLGEINGLKIVESFYDRDNWCCVFEKVIGKGSEEMAEN